MPIGVAALAGGDLVVGGAAVLDRVAMFAASARSEVVGELFKVTDEPIVEALVGTARSGRDVRLLRDPEFAGTEFQSSNRLAEAGVSFLDSLPLPAKVHSKSITVDGEQSLITTAAWIGESRGRFDLGVQLAGTPARLLRDLTLGSGNLRRTREVASELATAARRGVDTRVASRKIAADESAILDAADVAHGVIPMENAPFHANVAIFDDRAYVGTAHFTNRALGLSSQRSSREIGVVIDRPDQVRELRALVLDRMSRVNWSVADSAS